MTTGGDDDYNPYLPLKGGDGDEPSQPFQRPSPQPEPQLSRQPEPQPSPQYSPQPEPQPVVDVPSLIRRTGRRLVFPLVALGLILGLGLVGSVVNQSMRPDDSGTADPTGGPTSSSATELPFTWVVEPSAIVAGTELVYTWDGQVGSSQMAVSPQAWMVGLGADYETLQHIAGLDPETGETLWTYEVGQGACGQDVIDGQLACLATSSSVAESGIAAQPYRLVLIDVATGEVRESPTAITSVRSLSYRPEGLLVLGVTEPAAPHAAISLVSALDGSSLWTSDIGTIAGAELMFSDFLSGSGDKPSRTREMERVRWRELGDGSALLWSQPGALIIDLASGPVGSVIDCARATPTEDALYCMTYDDPNDNTVTSVHRYDRQGVQQWSTPGLRLAFPSDSTPGRPVALVGRDVVGLDLATGTPGAVLYSFATPGAQAWTGNIAEPDVYGNASNAVVIGEDDAALSMVEGEDRIAWTVPLSDAYVWDVLYFEGVTVLNLSDSAVGVDPVTGAELWRYEGISDDSHVAGRAIAETSYLGVSRRELP